MNNQKIIETLDRGSFLKELAEEGNVKFGFAKKLGINTSVPLKRDDY